MSIDNINFLSSPSSTIMKTSINQHHDNMIDNNEIHYDCDNRQKMTTDYDSSNENRKEDDDDNIIPWKKLLRKTNSRLNLIS